MNKQAITKRMYDDARTPSAWAIMRGFRPPTLYMLLAGRLRKDTPKCQEIIKALKADGYATEEDVA
jgi:hypothetical protein